MVDVESFDLKFEWFQLCADREHREFDLVPHALKQRSQTFDLRHKRIAGFFQSYNIGLGQIEWF